MINTEISPEVAALVEALVAIPAGGLAIYKDLSAAIGRDIQDHRWMLDSARDIAAREYGVVFGTERGIGLRRLTVDELAALGHTARAHIRRASRKAIKRMRYGVRRANDVSPIAQRKINAEMSVLGVIMYAASDKLAEPREEHDARPEPVGVTARRMLDALRKG